MQKSIYKFIVFGSRQILNEKDVKVQSSGVGLLYQQGYFRQVIDKDGGQQALYPDSFNGYRLIPACL